MSRQCNFDSVLLLKKKFPYLGTFRLSPIFFVCLIAFCYSKCHPGQLCTCHIFCFLILSLLNCYLCINSKIPVNGMTKEICLSIFKTLVY